MHNCAPLTSHSKLHEFGAEKPISWAKPTHFFTIHFIVWSQILSTGDDALTLYKEIGFCFRGFYLSFAHQWVLWHTVRHSRRERACEVALWGNSTEDSFTERQVRSQFCNLTHPGLYRGRRHYQWLPPLVHGVEGTDSSNNQCMIWCCRLPYALNLGCLHTKSLFQAGAKSGIALHSFPKFVTHWERNSKFF